MSAHRFLRLPVTVSLLLLLTACAGLPSVTLSSADRAQLKTVSIKHEVTMPQEMFYQGRAQAAGAAFGLLGALATQGMANEPKDQIPIIMKKNQIDLPTIVRAEIEKALPAASLQVAAPGSKSDVELSLQVSVYGYAQKNGLSNTVYPMLNVSATMKTPDGKTIWQKTDYITALNGENNIGYEYPQFVEKPERLRETMTKVSGMVARLLVADLNQDR